MIDRVLPAPRDPVHHTHAVRQTLLTQPGRTLVKMLHENGPAVRYLRALCARDSRPDHNSLDALGTAKSTAQARALLVAAGVLPPRDERLARLELAARVALSDVKVSEHANVLDAWMRWEVLRRARMRSDRAFLTVGQVNGALAMVRAAARFVVDIEHAGVELGTVSQAYVDSWLSKMPHDGRRVKSFISWCVRTGTCRRLEVRDPTRFARTFVAEDPTETWGRIVQLTKGTPRLPAQVQFAAALVILYGVSPQRIVRLRRDQLRFGAGGAELKLGSDWLRLPPFLEAAATGVARAARAPQGSALAGVARNTDSEWLFSGLTSSGALSAGALRRQLQRAGVDIRACVRNARASLAKSLPPTVVERAFGLSSTTATEWAAAVAASDLDYTARAMRRIFAEAPRVGKSPVRADGTEAGPAPE